MSKWTKIDSKKKPEDGVHYLAYFNGYVEEVVYCEKVKGFTSPYHGQECMSTINGITHWRKMPKGPKL